MGYSDVSQKKKYVGKAYDVDHAEYLWSFHDYRTRIWNYCLESFVTYVLRGTKIWIISSLDNSNSVVKVKQFFHRPHFFFTFSRSSSRNSMVSSEKSSLIKIYLPFRYPSSCLFYPCSSVNNTLLFWVFLFSHCSTFSLFGALVL